RGAAVAAPGGDPAADVTVASVAQDTATTPAVTYVTAADLAAFEARLRDTFSAPSTSGLAQVAVASTTPQLSGDIRRLIEESEERARQEMAERFIDLVRDLEGHRRADMMRVQQALGQVQRTTGAEAAQTRDIVNRLMLVSQGQQER